MVTDEFQLDKWLVPKTKYFVLYAYGKGNYWLNVMAWSTDEKHISIYCYVYIIHKLYYFILENMFCC
jgi:hypothetical protein